MIAHHRLAVAARACAWGTLVPMLFASVALAQVQPLANIRPGNAASRDYVDLMVASEDAVLFSADDGSTGPALWRSDGTPAGTGFVADLFGPSGFFPSAGTATAVGPLAYFAASDGFTGAQLWRSDATAAGTIALTTPTVLADVVVPGPGLIPYRDRLVFQYKEQLWSSNGSAAGTAATPVDIQLSNLPFARVDDAVHVYGRALAVSPDYGMLRTDLSVAGTALVGADTSLFQPRAVNGRLYFVHSTAGTGAELYTLAAGAMSPQLVRDIVTGPGSSNPQFLTRVDDRLFFVANDPTAGEELWVSDGSEAGTQRVADIVVGPNSSSPRALTALGGTLYFAATTPAAGTELWRSDGSAAGTSMVVDLNPGANNGLTGSVLYNSRGAIAAVNGRLFFQGRNDNFGFGARLWMLDATHTNAVPIDQSTLSLGALVPFNGQLLFTGSRTSDGMEPYAADLLSLAGDVWCTQVESGVSDDAITRTSTALLPARATVFAPTVELDLAHANIGDLTVSLRHRETGTTVTLLDRPGLGAQSGGCASDLIDIEFKDGATSSANDSCALSDQRLAYPRDTSHRPLQPLSTFNGESLAGHWELRVTDHAAGASGSLNRWCMRWFGPALFGDGFE